MSIVDKTLQRLGTPESVPEGRPPGAPTSLPHDLLYVAGARKPRRPVALWLGGVFLAGGAAAYFLIPDPAAVPPAPTFAPVVAQPAPVAAVPEAQPAPPPETKPVPEAKPLLVVEVKPVAAPEVKPVPATEAKLASEAQTVPDPVVKPAPVARATVTNPDPVVSPDWLREGWAAMSATKGEQALALWEAGLRSLPDTQPLIVGYAYLDRHGMNTALSRRDPNWAAFAIREGRFPRGGEPRYRLIVLPPSSASTGLNADVSALFGRADRVSAGYMKRRLLVANGASVPEFPARAEITPEVTSQPVAAASLAPPVKAPPKKVPQAAPNDSPQVTPKAATVAQSGSSIEDGRDWGGRSEAIREQLRQGAYGPAAEGAEKLSRDFPDRWEPLHWLGTAQLARGRLGEAENALERATALNPHTPHVWIQRAVAAQERQDHTAAVNYLREAEKLAPRMPEIFLNKGLSHDAQGQTNDAEKSFSRFLTLTDGVAAYAIQRKHIQNRLQR